jgi:hypothetical protein
METVMMSSEDVKEKSREVPAKANFLNLFKCKCPRCRQGDMFENTNPYILKETMRMNKYCPVCQQPLNIEVGFYYGSSYVSYAAAIAVSVATFIAWWVIIGFSLNDNRFFYWLGANAIVLVLLQPYLMRVARTFWLAFFVRYDKNWKTRAPQPLERTNDKQEGNW